MSIFRLPNELITETLKVLGGDNPYRNTRNARHACKLLNELGNPIGFRKLEVVADKGTQPIRRHLRFLEDEKQLAQFVQHLTITGRSFDPIPNFEVCFVFDADDITKIAMRLPSLEALTIRRGFIRGGYGLGPQPEFKNLTTLEMLDTTLLTTAPFPENVTHHLRSIKSLAVSFSPASLIHQQVTNGLALTSFPITSLSFPCTIPFAPAFITAAITAARGLRRVKVELPTVVLPPFFMDFPHDIDLGIVPELDDFELAMPVVNFPNQLAAESTWTYAGNMLESLNQNNRRTTVTFACDDIEWEPPYLMLSEFPVIILIDFAAGRGPGTELIVVLQAPEGSEAPSWEIAKELNEDWKRLEGMPGVTLKARLDDIDYSPFSPPYPLDDEEEDAVFMWWDGQL